MKQRLQGAVAGVLIGALCAGGVAFAKSRTENIEVTYDNIKVYKDNVLCELKDANGNVIEPFIYNGTTYMPVRGAANIAGMDVTWDGNTKSVYLWDNLAASNTYLMEVCPPYETSGWYKAFLQSEGESFSMAGEKYSNGFYLQLDGSSALFNLDSKYSTINFTVGHIDNSGDIDMSVSFLVDGKLVKEIDVTPEDMPKTLSIPVNYGLQMKIIVNKLSPQGNCKIGFGNITVE